MSTPTTTITDALARIDGTIIGDCYRTEDEAIAAARIGGAA
jgi:hypothetical protein